MFELYPDQMEGLSVANDSLHHILCKQKGYQCEDGIDCNPECADLEYCMRVNMIVNRNKTSTPFARTTNNGYFGYNINKQILDQKNEQINTLKLHSLNNRRSILFLKSRQHDYERFKDSIATKDVARISTLVSTCISQGHSISSK